MFCRPETLPACPPPSPGPAFRQSPAALAENSGAADGPVRSGSSESAADELVASCPCPFSAESTEHSSGVVGAPSLPDDGPVPAAVASEDASAAYHTVGSQSSGGSVDATFGSTTQHLEDGMSDSLNEESAGASGTTAVPGTAKQREQAQEEWSLEKLVNLSRKFNLDLAPKVS